MQNYNPLEFKSDFSESRVQMISELDSTDATKAFEILQSINEILSNELNKISIKDDNSKINLWKLFFDLKNETEKLNINCLFQSTMSSLLKNTIELKEVQETKETKEVKESEKVKVAFLKKDIINTTEDKKVTTPDDIDPDDMTRDINLFSNSNPKDKELVETVKKEVKSSEIFILNKPEYRFLLKIDDITGVIWVVSNRSHAQRLKISSKVIPITETQKNKFIRQRSGYSNKTDNPVFDFQASYISQASKPAIYDEWKTLINNTYGMFAQSN